MDEVLLLWQGPGQSWEKRMGILEQEENPRMCRPKSGFIFMSFFIIK